MRFASLADRNMKEVYRDPIFLALGLLLPAILLLLFTSIGRNAPIDIFTPTNLTPGIIVFSFGFLVMFSGTLLSKDRQSAFLSRLLTSPMRPVDFILAFTLPFIPVAFLQIIVGLIMGIVLGAHLTIGLLAVLPVLLLMSVACIGIGMILGSLLTENQVAGAGSIVIVVISLFSGAWMDLEMVGGVFELLGNALPFFHAIEACRVILTGGTTGIASHLYWVGGYAVILSVAGIAAFRLKTRPK